MSLLLTAVETASDSGEFIAVWSNNIQTWALTLLVAALGTTWGRTVWRIARALLPHADRLVDMAEFVVREMDKAERAAAEENPNDDPQ